MIGVDILLIASVIDIKVSSSCHDSEVLTSKYHKVETRGRCRWVYRVLATSGGYRASVLLVLPCNVVCVPFDVDSGVLVHTLIFREAEDPPSYIYEWRRRSDATDDEITTPCRRHLTGDEASGQ